MYQGFQEFIFDTPIYGITTYTYTIYCMTPCNNRKMVGLLA